MNPTLSVTAAEDVNGTNAIRRSCSCCSVAYRVTPYKLSPTYERGTGGAVSGARGAGVGGERSKGTECDRRDQYHRKTDSGPMANAAGTVQCQLVPFGDTLSDRCALLTLERCTASTNTPIKLTEIYGNPSCLVALTTGAAPWPGRSRLLFEDSPILPPRPAEIISYYPCLRRRVSELAQSRSPLAERGCRAAARRLKRALAPRVPRTAAIAFRVENDSSGRALAEGTKRAGLGPAPAAALSRNRTRANGRPSVI